MTNRVYVDAKIEGIQDPKLPRKAYVAYVVEGVPGLQGLGKVDAYETDDAELHAIAFAIQQLFLHTYVLAYVRLHDECYAPAELGFSSKKA